MKREMKKISLFLCLMVVLVLCTFACLPIARVVSAGNDDQSLYSKNNAPIFYGATKITIDKNVTSKFDRFDPRFRIFAKDFEDGDLTDKIVCTYNNVVGNVPGNYEIKYEVTDSHSNNTTLIVPVTVTNNENYECVIERTLYTLANMSHLEDVNVYRCHAGDKQILGVFMPADSSVYIKTISADKNIKISFWGNNTTKECEKYISLAAEDYVEFKNVNNKVSYDSVPFVQSMQQDKRVSVNKTYIIEIKYNSEQVKKLDYFYDGDDETKFKEKWKLSKNAFAVVDSGSATILTQFDDISSLPDGSDNTNKFKTLQVCIDYYKECVKRMSDMIGLKIDPIRATDQEIRSKYFMRANEAQKYVLAYYANNADYIGIANNKSVAAFFTYGWGTLHEIGHGFQGSFGRGIGGGENIRLHETGNNILAHYIQIDETLYPKANTGGLHGTLRDIEVARNTPRLNGNAIFYSGDYNNERFYMLINLLDTFDKQDTYAKLFSCYRNLMLNKKQTNFTIAEVYAMFFAETYGANIMPYLDAWKIKIGDNVARSIMQMDLEAYLIPGDITSGETLDEIKQNENITLTYGLTKESIIQKYDLSANLTLNIEIDNIDTIKNKRVYIYKNGSFIQDVKINEKTLKFYNLDIGTYEIRLPIDFDYDNDYLFVTLASGENEVSYNYKKTLIKDNYKYHQSRLVIWGRHMSAGSIGCEIKLSNNNRTATISYSGADLGNRVEPYTTTKLNDTFILLQIINDAGSVIFEREVKGNEYFSTSAQTLPDIEIKPGYKIKLYTEKPNYVKVLSLETNNELSVYNSSEKNLEYEITKFGLKMLGKDFDEEEILYEDTKPKYIGILENYKQSATTKELANRRINTKQKLEVICSYNTLKDEDRQEYDELVAAIKKGGSPVVTIQKTQITVDKYEDYNFYELLKITDNEDGIIKSDADSVKIIGFNNGNVGWQTVTLKVSDSDGNTQNITLSVQVKQNETEVLVAICGILLAIVIVGVVTMFMMKTKREKKNMNLPKKK